MNFRLLLSTDNASWQDIDLFYNQNLNYDAEFYDDKNVSDIKVPFYTDIKIPLSANNKVFFSYDPLSSNVSSFPSSEYYYKIYVENSSNTVLRGLTKVTSIEYNSDEPYIELDLKDFLTVFLSDLKELKLGDVLTSSYHTSRHTMSDFLNTTSNGGEAGTINSTPDLTRIVNFPYIDFANDLEKFTYAYRQFTEYGSGTERVGLVPSISVKNYLKQIGDYLNTIATPVQVKSKLFGINETEALPDFEPSKLQAVLPSKLQAKVDVNTRKFPLLKAPRQSGRNTNLTSEYDLDGNRVLVKTAFFGDFATFGNYSSTPSTTYQEFGIRRQTTNLYGQETQGETGYFCPHMSFDGKIQWYNGNRSNPSGNIKIEFPTVGDSNFVYKVLNTNQNTDMTFGIFMDIYEDGFPRKRLRLNDSSGTPIVLTAQSATATTGTSEKSNSNPTPSNIGPDFAIKYTAIWGLLNDDKPAILDSTRQSDYADALEWPSVDLYLPSDDELGMTFYGDSRYGYNIFVEPLDGKMYFQTIASWLAKTSSGGTPSLPTGVHHFESDSHRTDLLGESFIKKTVSSFSGTALNIECKADRDFNPYFPDDEFVIKDSINNTTDLSPVDFLSIVCKRFGCGIFYEFSNNTHVLRIDPLHILRTQGSTLNEKIDDLRSIKLTSPKDSIKNLILTNKDYGLYYDDFDGDGVTIGSTTQEINSIGINDLELSFDSSIHYKTLCGPEYIELSDKVTNGIVSEKEAGVVKNVPPLRTDIGVRFAYISAPDSGTQLQVPYCITYISRDGLGPWETQRIYREMYNWNSMTPIDPHVFNGLLSHVNSSGFDLRAEDENENTTDYYDFISSTEQIKSKSSVEIEFSMIVPTNSVSNVLFMLEKNSLSYINNQNVLVKSVSGNVFEENTYLDVKGIIE